MFGFLHVLLSLFQQLFNATLLGIILGLLAVRSRSILPGILFHFLNNAIAVARGYWVTGSTGSIDRGLDLSQPDGRSLSWRLDRRRASCSRAAYSMLSPSEIATSRPTRSKWKTVLVDRAYYDRIAHLRAGNDS